MDFLLLFKSIIIGFSIAAPVGPIGVLCIQRTLRKGFKSGLLTGFGAATADGFYGIVAAFGLGIISVFLLEHQTILRLLGGLFLIYLGLKNLLPNLKKESKKEKTHSLIQDYISSFFLTITNPATILAFLAIFIGFDFIEKAESVLISSQIVFGVIIGSLLWWLLLVLTVSWFESKVQIKKLRIVDILSGVVIIIFGLSVLITLF